MAPRQPTALPVGQLAEEDAPPRRAAVHLLGHRDERHAGAAEDIERLEADAQVASEPVHGVDDHDIDLTGADIVEQAAEFRPPGENIGAGRAALLAVLPDDSPAAAGRVGTTGTGLSVKRVALHLYTPEQASWLNQVEIRLSI